MINSIVTRNHGKLAPNARRFLAAIAAKEKRVFSIEDAIPYWSSPHQARKALSRLQRNGWIERLERGLYLIVPLEAGPERRWTEDPLVLAAQMAPEGVIAYWTASHYWGMTEQVPRTTFVQITNRRSRPKISLLGMRFQFVTIVWRKLFGETRQSGDGMEFKITDREKTIVDACDRPDLSGGILQIAQTLETGEPLEWEKVDAYLQRMKSGAIYKRLGFLIERLEIELPSKEQMLSQWRAAITEGIADLEPGRGRKGRIESRWRIRVNVDLPENLS